MACREVTLFEVKEVFWLRLQRRAIPGIARSVGVTRNTVRSYVETAVACGLAGEPVDFRNGIDGLVHIARDVLGADPMSGCLFVWRNRRGSALKLLGYDSQVF